MTAKPLPRRADAQRALLGELKRRLGGAAAAETRPWASATFVGAQHHVRLTLEGETARAEARRWRRTIACEEFRLRGHLLASIAVTATRTVAGGVLVEIDALTLEEA